MVTPFSPDTRFKIANAIRANKYQYALSDAAVIVETRQTGGVWLGADENRQEGWVPAFVRAGENMAPGNLALLHLGLRPITRQDVAASANLHEFFLTHGLSGHGSGAAAEAAAPVDLYSIFAAELRSFVSAAPRSLSEIAGHFAIELSQARAWLARASGDGVVKKTGADAWGGGG
jgi:predicted Rossmann fold nucleotide-binding protein DprA/Smf involved in DNA uptake